MSWQEFFPRHCLNEVALLRGFLGNLTRQVSRVFFLFFHHYFFPHHCVTLSICEYWNHSQSINGFLDHRFFHLHFWEWLKGRVFVERRNRFAGGVLGSFSIDLKSFWTIDFSPENHCGRCTTTPSSLVQIWVLHLGGFPVICLEISLKLAENRTSCVLWCKLWPLTWRNQKGAKPRILGVDSGTFWNIFRPRTWKLEVQLASYVKFIIFGRFSS